MVEAPTPLALRTSLLHPGGGAGVKTLALYWQEPGKNERPLSVMLSRKLGRKRQWDKEG